MKMVCIDASGKGGIHLTEGEVYNCMDLNSGYYELKCDDGKSYSKLKSRFKFGVRSKTNLIQLMPL